MTLSHQDIQDQILLRTLEDVPFDGWQWNIVCNAAQDLGYEPDMAEAVFPEKLQDVLIHFSSWADRQMLQELEKTDIETLRIRDRIDVAVKKRLGVLEDHKEALRASVGYWAHPFRKIQAGKIIWRTADQIWNWAGDDSKDYNHYTKRGLLSGIIVSTTLVWLNDKSDNHEDSHAFLSRRIDNVLQFGKAVHKMKSYCKTETA